MFSFKFLSFSVFNSPPNKHKQPLLNEVKKIIANHQTALTIKIFAKLFPDVGGCYFNLFNLIFSNLFGIFLVGCLFNF